jgi:hypothetical protein
MRQRVCREAARLPTYSKRVIKVQIPTNRRRVNRSGLGVLDGAVIRHVQRR